MTFAVVASVYVPVAMKLVVKPALTVVTDGLIAIAVNMGAVTVKVALLEVTPPTDAEIFDVPTANEEAMPLALSVATAVLLDVQITAPETLPVVPSEYVPVAENVTGLPFGVEGTRGLMLIPVNTAVVTDRLAAGEVTPFADAVIVVLPTATPVATPEMLLIVATPVLPDVHITWFVILAVVLSE